MKTDMPPLSILLIGAGAREHALAWKLSGEAGVGRLVCAPGNPGMAQVAEIADVAVDDYPGLLGLVDREGFDLVVVGPEAPLAAGLADALLDRGVPVFGPTQGAARLEASKGFTKAFCDRHGIPTADYQLFEALDAAVAHLEARAERGDSGPYVLKADGLAAGKGVVIAEDADAARAALEEMFGGRFGEAGATVVIEDFLEGEEVSFFAVSDGQTAWPLLAAQDHKRVGEGDTGPNTGGMGAYSPAPVWTPELEREVMETIIGPTVSGMRGEGHEFRGVLFAGLMVTEGGPKLIEYNVRFGDPECQVLMRRMASELAPLLLACALGDLSDTEPPAWFGEPCVNVVMATQGYPGAYEKGSVIRGVEEAEALDGVVVFQAGTRVGRNCGRLKANGGRVLSVTAVGETLPEAVERAYGAVDSIDWPEGFVRRDIGWRALGRG